MKSDEAVFAELEREKSNCVDGAPVTPRFMIAGEAPILLSKACELLVKEVTIRAWRHTERNRRRTLQKQDVQAAVGESEVYDFLIDIVPRVQLNQGKHFATGAISGPSATQVPENVVTIDQASLIVRGGETAAAKQETDMNLIHLQQMQYNIMLQQQQHQQQHQQLQQQQQQQHQQLQQQQLQQHQQHQQLQQHQHQHQQVKHDQNASQSHNHQVTTTSQQQQQTDSQQEQQVSIDDTNNIHEVQTVNLNDHTILTHQIQCANQFAQTQQVEGSQIMSNQLTQPQTSTKQQDDQLQVQQQSDQGQIHSGSEPSLYIPQIHYMGQHRQQSDSHPESNQQKQNENQEVESNKS
jgi:histone H3/H4